MISIPMKINSATSIPVTVSASVVQPTGQMQAKTNINPTTSSQTITADVGYDGLSSVQINAMPSGSAATPATSITANPSISVNSSTGVITASVSKTQSVTPTVSAGYVASGTSGIITVSGGMTSSLTTQGAQTITPTTSDQTIASGKYLTGAQTIKGDANLVATNIKKDVEIFGVTGSYEGGGGGGTPTLYQNGTGNNQTLYAENTIIDSAVEASLIKKLKGASNLKTVKCLKSTAYGGSGFQINTAFQGCPLLETVQFLNGISTSGYAEDLIKDCPNIKSVTFGDIGYPNTSAMGSTTSSYYTFRNVTVAFDIIIYTTATSISDVPSALKTGSPWGATNATVIYKNSTTGAILT